MTETLLLGGISCLWVVCTAAWAACVAGHALAGAFAPQAH